MATTSLLEHSQISGRLRGGRLWTRRHSVYHRASIRSPAQLRASAIASALPPALQQKCDEWLALEDSSGREAAQNFFTSSEAATLQDALGQRLVFGAPHINPPRRQHRWHMIDIAIAGTAGLRGLVGTGFNRMNNIVVQQTTQGFCKYLQQQAEQKLSSRGVVIGTQHSLYL